MSLPPGPRVPAVGQAIAYHRDPLGVLRRARARYGAVFTLRITDPVVFVADPAAVEPLLRSDTVVARAGAARRAILPLASPHSLFGADRDEHRTLRAAMAPCFEAFAPDEIAAIARRHIATWPV